MKYLLILLYFLPLLAQAQEAEETTYRYAVNVAKRLELELKHASTINIKSHSGNELIVKAKVLINDGQANKAFTVSQEQSGDIFRIVTILDMELAKQEVAKGTPCNCPDGSNWSFSKKEGKSYNVCLKVDIEVLLPKGKTISLNTISADITANDIEGDIKLKSISGFIDLTWPKNAGGKVKLKSVTGELYTNLELSNRNKAEEFAIVGYEIEGEILGSKMEQNIALETVSSNIYLRQ